MGLVVRKCHFDVTACAEARRLDKDIVSFAPQVYEPEPGRETPEEKRLREVNIVIFFVLW